jgi:hypothetical protein
LKLMGTYYSLVDDTERKSLHLDYHVKYDPIRFNKAVHRAFVNYMFEHPGNSFRIISDTGAYSECDDYEEINLIEYEFAEKGTMQELIAELNLVYANGRYGMTGGLGVRHLTMRTPGRLWACAIFGLAKCLIGLGYRLAKGWAHLSER